MTGYSIAYLNTWGSPKPPPPAPLPTLPHSSTTILHLNPDDCKNELLRLNLTRNKNTDRKIVNLQVLADFVHQAELERYQGLVQLDEKYPYNGAHGSLTYDIHDKHWIPHIGINNPSKCKANTKNKGYQK